MILCTCSWPRTPLPIKRSIVLPKWGTTPISTSSILSHSNVMIWFLTTLLLIPKILATLKKKKSNEQKFNRWIFYSILPHVFLLLLFFAPYNKDQLKNHKKMGIIFLKVQHLEYKISPLQENYKHITACTQYT